MLSDYLSRLVHWFSRDEAESARGRERRAKRDACKHGGSERCPYAREQFDCADCEVDEQTGEMRPRA